MTSCLLGRKTVAPHDRAYIEEKHHSFFQSPPVTNNSSARGYSPELIISPFNLAFVQSDLWQIWCILSQLLCFLSSIFLGLQKSGVLFCSYLLPLYLQNIVDCLLSVFYDDLWDLGRVDQNQCSI